ncbi:MAG: SusC/RagA family TonB-linked outer membrane protein [Leadbetterella sp.]
MINKRLRLYRSHAVHVSKHLGRSIALMSLFSLFFVSFSFAQSISIAGRVMDNEAMGIPGVTVQVKNASKATVTDGNGNYKLDGVSSTATLVFSFVGLTTQEVTVNSRSTIDVTLSDDEKLLEEVVVVGYGTVKKKDATGAVNAIAAKDFQKGVVTSPEQLMQGRVAGVQITQSSGEPGGGINVRIRGTSSVFGGNNPLFVIDGVPLSGDNTSGAGDVSGIGRQAARNPLNFLNPDDIASMDILKDASATAIYGSRGANGVVLITTKKGKGKGSLNYGVSVGASTITQKYDLLSAEEFARANPSANKGANVDYQDELFRTGMTQQHNLSFGGGDETSNYRMSFGYLDQEGIILNSSIKRYSGGFSGGKKFINNKLNILTSINVSNTLDQGVPISENSGFEGDLLASILKFNPTQPIYNTVDGRQVFNQPGNTEPNPLAFVNLSKDNTNTLRALGNISAEYEFVKGFKFKTVLGFDKSLSERKAAYSRDLVVTGIQNVGRAYFRDVDVNNNLWENYFTYDKSFGNTNFSGLLGYSYQSFSSSSKNFSLANFNTSDLDLMINNTASSRQNTVGSSISPNSSSEFDELQSYYGRVNLGMGKNSKILLTGTLRVDGSSRFGGDNKYGYFPSFAAKYKLIEEKFVPRSIFSDLALRVGYGLTGNQAIPHNRYSQRERYGNYSVDNAGTNVTGGGLNAVAFNNPELKWETTTSTNIAIDFGILKNKLTGSIDFYDKHTKDLLFYFESVQPAPQPFVWSNLDSDIQNRGVEFSFVYSAVDKKKFGWEVLLNTAFNKNEIKSLEGSYQTGGINGQGLSGAFAQQLEAGQPLFAYYLREFGGYDAEGNTLYPAGDFQQFLDGKSPLPTMTGGLTNNFRYGNFDVSIFFNGVFGNYIYSNTANAFFTKGSLANGRNVTRNVVDLKEGPLNAPDVSTRFLEKGDFVRLQNLNLGYRVPVKNKNISNIRVFVTGQNLLTFTNYTGQDPEVSTNKTLNDIPSFGIDYSAYPRARTWTFGANFSF